MATYDEQDAVDRVWMLLRDYGQNNAEQLLTDTEIKALGIRGAEGYYSRIRPRDVIADVLADGTSYLAMPSGWVDGLSALRAIESPPDAVPANVIDPRDYYIGYTSLGAPRIVFRYPPSNGVTVRVTFSAGRVLAPAAANTTILDPDFIAFADCAASICADAIAAKYARTSEPAIGADVVNYRTRAQEWRDIAKRLWERWQQGMGMGSGAEGGSAVPAASAWANWDLAASWGTYRTLRRRM